MAEIVGREILRRVMEEKGLAQAAVAELASVSQVAVSQWLTGKSRPDAQARDALELALAIPRESWRTEEEARALLSLVRADRPRELCPICDGEGRGKVALKPLHVVPNASTGKEAIEE